MIEGHRFIVCGTMEDMVDASDDLTLEDALGTLLAEDDQDGGVILPEDFLVDLGQSNGPTDYATSAAYAADAGGMKPAGAPAGELDGRVQPLERSGPSLHAIVAERWLRNEEVFDVLSHPFDGYGLAVEPEAVQLPASGTVLLYDRAALRGFRFDGHAYRRKKEGRALEETHCKLKVGGVARLVCYYSWTADGTIARRIYSLLDEKNLALVHYFRHEAKEPKAKPPLDHSDVASTHSASAASRAAAGAATKLAAEAATQRVALLEERVRELERENERLRLGAVTGSGLLPPRQAVGGEGAASGAQSTGVPPLGALPVAAGEPEGRGGGAWGGPAPAVGSGDAGGQAPVDGRIAAASADDGRRVEHPPPPPLLVAALAPAYASVRGGSSVLIAARTREGCRYGGCFGLSAAAPASVVLPNVLRIEVPPSSTGSVGGVPFCLLRLADDGEVLEISPSYPFAYTADEAMADAGVGGRGSGRDTSRWRATRAVARRARYGGDSDISRGGTDDEDDGIGDGDGEDDAGEEGDRMLLGDGEGEEGDTEGDEDDDEELAAAAAEAEAEAAAEEAQREGRRSREVPREVRVAQEQGMRAVETLQRGGSLCPVLGPPPPPPPPPSPPRPPDSKPARPACSLACPPVSSHVLPCPRMPSRALPCPPVPSRTLTCPRVSSRALCRSSRWR